MPDKRMNDTKNQIIEITLDEIREQGYTSISMRKIAQKYNITGTALYRHFQNKDDLLNQALIRISQDIYHQYEANLQKLSEFELDVKHKLIILGETILTASEQNKKLMDFLFFSDYARESYQTTHKTPFALLEIYKNLIHQIKTDVKPDIDEKSLFIELWAFIQGYTLLIINGVAYYDEKLLKQTLEKLI